MENIDLQADEIEALCSIYDNFMIEGTGVKPTYTMNVTQHVCLNLALDEQYPTSAPPNYDLIAPTLSTEVKAMVDAEFAAIFRNNPGVPILYQWIEKLKEIVEKHEVPPPRSRMKEVWTPYVKVPHVPVTIVHGSIIEDRKSFFQGHFGKVESFIEIKVYIDYLLTSRKIAQAAHNVFAFRILNPDLSITEDFEDDGETHAGRRLLRLLQMMNVANVILVVSRWDGGIHLGPDRFKHITNAARRVLLEAGAVPKYNASP